MAIKKRRKPRGKPAVRETVTLYEAKTNLSSLVERAAQGAEFVIAKSGRPKALLVPITDTRYLRVSGRGRGKWKVAPDFDFRLPEDVAAGFEP